MEKFYTYHGCEVHLTVKTTSAGCEMSYTLLKANSPEDEVVRWTCTSTVIPNDLLGLVYAEELANVRVDASLVSDTNCVSFVELDLKISRKDLFK